MGVESISTVDLKEIKIPLPPLEVQKQIVEECETIDAEVATAQTIVEQSKAAIAEKIENIYQTETNKIEIGRISTSVQYGINEAMNEAGKGYKIFRMNEIIEGKMFDGGKMKYADISAEEFAKYKLNKGDILFNRTNSLEHVGKTGVFTLEGDYCYASYLIRVRVMREIANPYFVNLMMNSNAFQTEAKSKAAKAINQANINAEKMKSIKIPVPPLPVQEKLVAEIAELETKIREARKIIESAAERKQAMMKRYL